MCYNCGCQRPNDDMGKGPVSKGGGSLVEEDIKHIAEVWHMDVPTTKRNIIQLLQKTLSTDTQTK